MCGRYVLRLRPAEVRQQLEQSQMPCEEAPADDQIRQTYNFAPGYNGIVYRSDTPDSGAARPGEKDSNDNPAPENVTESQDPKYKLQAMKWGLIPSWMKRKPDYGSMMKTINCRDDSLAENRGLWNSVKHRKRCIVVCQGFYEWLKKNGGKEKIPYFVKRKDGQLMCFAGLWDCVRFEGSEEKLFTYTIITTSSNKQLSFLHDRMPVIFDNGSASVWKWLDPRRNEWNRELQSLLKPYEGELEYYPVPKEVGKVGNDSPSFIIPVDSKENKSNISNFFDNQRKAARSSDGKRAVEEHDLSASGLDKVGHVKGEARSTSDKDGTEDNAPLPTPGDDEDKRGIKREHEAANDTYETPGSPPRQKAAKVDAGTGSTDKSKATKGSAKLARKTRSATSNGTAQKGSPAKASDGSRKITAFFGK